MGSIPTLTPSLRRESLHGARCIPREYLQQYSLIGSTPIPSTTFYGDHPVWHGNIQSNEYFSNMYHVMVRFLSPRQFLCAVRSPVAGRPVNPG